MPVNKYRKSVLDVLQGKTPELQDIPPERLDWDGTGALFELYHRTSGKDRTAIIRAIGDILREHTAPVPVLAQLVDIASGLDLAEIESDIQTLQSEPIASEEHLRQSITNYLVYRKLMANGHTASTAIGLSTPPPSTQDRPRTRRRSRSR